MNVTLQVSVTRDKVTLVEEGMESLHNVSDVTQVML